MYPRGRFVPWRLAPRQQLALLVRTPCSGCWHSRPLSLLQISDADETGWFDRTVQSCMKVALDFVSPEGVMQCLKQVKHLRQLPEEHGAKEDKLQVRGKSG